MANALKAIVIIMGLMILAGLTLLGAIVAGRFAHRSEEPVAAPAPRAGASAYTAAPLGLPPGARVNTMTIGGDRLVLDVALPGGDDELVILNLATGRTIGTIPLHTAPPRAGH